MKITFISEYFPGSDRLDIRGGVEARCYLVAKRLAEKHEVTVICSREKGMNKEDTISGVKVFRVGSEREYSQNSSFLGRISFMIAAFFKSLRTKADIIEGENYFAYFPAFFSAKFKRVPAVAMYADVLLGTWISHLGLFWGCFWEIVERFILMLPWDYYITISNSTKNKLKKKNVKVVYCPVDLSEFRQSRIKDSAPTVIAIARLINYKQLDVLIKALSTIRKKIKCKIIGTGPERSNLEKLAKDLEVDAEFLGFVKDHADVVRHLQKSHIFCLPSAIEGFGIVTIEAMAAGVPYVNSDIPVTREITENSEGGLLFKLGDHKDLAKKINKLLTQKELYRKKVKEGYALSKKYSIKTVAEQLDKIYLQIVK